MMEGLLRKLRDLPDAKLADVAKALVSSIVHDVETNSILRSCLASLIAVIGQEQLQACQEALAESGADRTFDYVRLVDSQPCMQAARRWCHVTHNIEVNAIIEVPVILVRFTTNDGNESCLDFKNQMSIFKTFDKLQRGITRPQDLEEPLEVCMHGGTLYTLSNKALFALLMYQAVNRHLVVQASCILRPPVCTSGKHEETQNTKHYGLGITSHCDVCMKPWIPDKPWMPAG